MCHPPRALPSFFLVVATLRAHRCILASFYVLLLHMFVFAFATVAFTPTFLHALRCHIAFVHACGRILGFDAHSTTSQIRARVKVKVPLKVYHVPKITEVDLTGMEGEIKQCVGLWKGKRIFANLPYKVQFVTEMSDEGWEKVDPRDHDMDAPTTPKGEGFSRRRFRHGGSRPSSLHRLSLKSQELTAMFLAIRLYCSFVMEYDIHTLLDLATLAMKLWVIYMIRFKLKSSYMEEKDNFAIYYVIVEPFTTHYVFALGVARFLSCAHWVLQVLDSRGHLLVAFGRACVGDHGEKKTQENLSEKISNISLTGTEQLEKFLLDKLDVYESAVGDSNMKCTPRIAGFPPAF
ncbi:hypothetical protein Fmac_009518 [Flemingia macrophylla]|uniref:Ferredoxin thioredoxin reductase alpha chain domain-containing protein n=1 Tax=Flemingia macrophylla TaxID=520843 RepID=A0ABD1N0H0_9FABA